MSSSVLAEVRRILEVFDTNMSQTREWLNPHEAVHRAYNNLECQLRELVTSND